MNVQHGFTHKVYYLDTTIPNEQRILLLPCKNMTVRKTRVKMKMNKKYITENYHSSGLERLYSKPTGHRKNSPY